MKFENLKTNYESRFFNKVIKKNDLIIKYSINKKNLFNEYKSLCFLSNSFGKWFANPIKFKHNSKYSYYKMKYYNLQSLAYQYICGNINLQDMEQIFDLIFSFIRERFSKKVSDAYDNYLALYNLKVYDRIEQLKNFKFYNKIDAIIAEITNYSSITDIINRYSFLFFEKMKKFKCPKTLVIGHGDLCFSNILYSKKTKQMVFVDPKGFKNDEDMWMNPYYDLAKISHSVCGNYDFINLNKYKIIDKKIEIDFDNTKYVNLFKIYIQKNGFEYDIVRLFEISLFLSMLPMHIENENKIAAFIVNAANIMDNIQKRM